VTFQEKAPKQRYYASNRKTAGEERTLIREILLLFLERWFGPKPQTKVLRGFGAVWRVSPRFPGVGWGFPGGGWGRLGEPWESAPGTSPDHPKVAIRTPSGGGGKPRSGASPRGSLAGPPKSPKPHFPRIGGLGDLDDFPDFLESAVWRNLPNRRVCPNLPNPRFGESAGLAGTLPNPIPGRGPGRSSPSSFPGSYPYPHPTWGRGGVGVGVGPGKLGPGRWGTCQDLG
jgi:hypothetical protein